ncbi:MAG: Smr/MutS family protein [Acidobacteriota bacterium]|nr:Smr/MutS family protein [Acidobacteriota bacterium]
MDDGDEPVIVPIEDAIDLHAFAPRDVLSVVDEYLRAARAAGFRQVRLIHGRGTGVQRAAVHRLLATHPLVLRYWDAPESSRGATMAALGDQEPTAPSPTSDRATPSR